MTAQASLGFDHIIAMVRDIDAASRDFADLGFGIVQRPDATLTETNNRFVAFPDGSYLQICAFFDLAKSSAHKWAPVLSAGEGWVDYSLRTGDVADVRARLAAVGVEIPEARVSTKPLTDGRSWVAAIMHAGRGIGASPLRPYFVEDRADRAIRVPPPAAPQPGNASGIVGVTLLSRDLDSEATTLSAIFGAGEDRPARLDGGRRTRLFQLSAGWLEIIEPMPGSALAAERDRRGDGVHEVLLGRPGLAPGDGRLLPIEKTHGARIRVG